MLASIIGDMLHIINERQQNVPMTLDVKVKTIGCAGSTVTSSLYSLTVSHLGQNVTLIFKDCGHSSNRILEHKSKL